MGLAIPRPAMRSREERMIRARLDYFAKREAELREQLVIHANDIAYKEARHLRFDRNGYPKGAGK
jgi:hypothetical protein